MNLKLNAIPVGSCTVWINASEIACILIFRGNLRHHNFRGGVFYGISDLIAAN